MLLCVCVLVFLFSEFATTRFCHVLTTRHVLPKFLHRGAKGWVCVQSLETSQRQMKQLNEDDFGLSSDRGS